MKITIVGSGYVGTSIGTILSQYNEVTILDISQEKVDLINNKKSPIQDPLIDQYLKTGNIKATTNKVQAYKDAEYIVIAVPTDYNVETNYFNTSLIEKVLLDIKKFSTKTTIIIKSTIPVGYVKNISTKMNMNNIIFSPEFLREGTALYDNLYPSRIIIGEKSERAKKFADLLIQGALKENISVIFTDSTEAEAIKLFANSYLAMRVAFFNELDSYAEHYNLSTKDIISGICTDERIGNYYNNPSFGYGGYCLPKDTKQLLSNFSEVPNSLISGIVKSNDIRKQNIVNQILSLESETVGIFRLTMKSDSDNFRSSAIQNIITELQKYKKIIIYEPSYKDNFFNGFPVIKNIDDFCSNSDIIIANRIESELEPYLNKVYTRDIFHSDK